MHTGQNSTAPENSLPQVGQTRLSSVFMGLTVLWMQPRRRKQSKAWRESSSRQRTMVAFHKKSVSLQPIAGETVFRNRIPATLGPRRLSNRMKTLISDLIPPLCGTALLGVSACLVSFGDFEAVLGRSA
jgi:hypothetical protein